MNRPTVSKRDTLTVLQSSQLQSGSRKRYGAPLTSQQKDRVYQRTSPSGAEPKAEEIHFRSEQIRSLTSTLIDHSSRKTQRAKNRISKRISDHAEANTWWDPKTLPNWLTEECYVQTIHPLLRGKKVREIAEAMQVSQPYAAFIRSGRRRPHPRHWLVLSRLVGLPAFA